MVSSFALGPVTEMFPWQAVHAGLSFVDPQVCGCLGPHHVLQTRQARLREGKRLPPRRPTGPVGASGPAVSASEVSVCPKLEARRRVPGGRRAAEGWAAAYRSLWKRGHPRPLPPCPGCACGLVRSLPGGAGTRCRCQVPGNEAECHRLSHVPGTVCPRGGCLRSESGGRCPGAAANKRTGEPHGSCGRGRASERGASTQLSAPNLGPPPRGRVAGPGDGLVCVSWEPEGLCSTLRPTIPTVQERTARRRWARVWGQ